MKTNSRKIFTCFAAITLSAICNSLVAEVSPEGGTINGIAYVGVRDEPQHRHEFENDQI